MVYVRVVVHELQTRVAAVKRLLHRGAGSGVRMVVAVIVRAPRGRHQTCPDPETEHPIFKFLII